MTYRESIFYSIWNNAGYKINKRISLEMSILWVSDMDVVDLKYLHVKHESIAGLCVVAEYNKSE